MRSILFAVALAATCGAVSPAPLGTEPAAPKPARRVPPAADATYATPALAARMDAYFRRKSAPSVDGVMAFYSRERTSYDDATLRRVNPSWRAVRDVFANAMPHFGGGAAYSVALFGDERSAVVLLVDTPELFGGDVHGVSAVDFDDRGQITRFVDYWDGRQFGRAAAEKLMSGSAEPPASFGEEGLPNRAAPAMRSVVAAISHGLSSGDVAAVAERLGDDVVFEDQALRVQLRGKPAVVRYLERADAGAPYGARSGDRHVVGSAKGGGYEWTRADGPVRMGVTALGVGPDGRVARMIVDYDTLAMSDEELAAAQRLALETDR